MPDSGRPLTAESCLSQHRFSHDLNDGFIAIAAVQILIAENSCRLSVLHSIATVGMIES